jgi:hypothetical protein
MQIHEVRRRPAPPPVQGLDTTKVSSYVAAQIAKAEADSQAQLAQTAKQAAPANPFGQMASSLLAPPTPAGPVATSTGGTKTRTDTGTQHTASSTNPNIKNQPSAVAAAMPEKPAVPRKLPAKTPSFLDKTKALGKATAAGYRSGGIGGAIKSNLSWDQYNTQLDKVKNPAAPMPRPNMLAQLAPTGLTQKGLAAAGQVLQKLSNGNKKIKKTGDRNVDALLSTMGYTLT